MYKIATLCVCVYGKKLKKNNVDSQEGQIL
jgi:hypothetical protein